MILRYQSECTCIERSRGSLGSLCAESSTEGGQWCTSGAMRSRTNTTQGRGPSPAQDRSSAPRGRRRATPGTGPRRRPPCLRNHPRHAPCQQQDVGQMPRRQQSAPPPRDAAKMSPRIRIGTEPVLAAHAPSPPAAVSHCPAREVSAPHCGTEFTPECNVILLASRRLTHQRRVLRLIRIVYLVLGDV